MFHVDAEIAQITNYPNVCKILIIEVDHACINRAYEKRAAYLDRLNNNHTQKKKLIVT